MGAMTTIQTTLSDKRGTSGGEQALAERFRAWRATRQRGERIPEELWRGAVEYARCHGLSATAALLKLSYYVSVV